MENEENTQLLKRRCLHTCKLGHCTMGKVVMFHYFWRVSSFKLDFLSHFWVKSISFCSHQNPLSLRIQKMSLLFQIGPPKVELWPFKHLKHSFQTSCQNGGKSFLFLFLHFYSFPNVNFSTLSYRRQNGGTAANVH